MATEQLVNSSLIVNSKKVESIQMGISPRMDGRMVVNPSNGILFSKERGELATVWMSLRDIVLSERRKAHTER